MRALFSQIEAIENQWQNAKGKIYDELDRLDKLVEPNGNEDPDPVPIPEPMDISRFKKKSPFTLEKGVEADFYNDIPILRDDREHPEKFDIWIPENAGKDMPLVIFVHGGGFHSYDKTVTWKNRTGIDVTWEFPKDINELLRNGIAFCALGYAKLDMDNPKQSKRSWELLDRLTYSYQFMKYHAPNFGISRDKTILAGISAGSFWSHHVFFGPDQADANNKDEVKRISTKPFTVATRFTNTVEDVRIWENEIFKEFGFNMLEFYSKLPPVQKQLALTKFQASFGIEKIEDLYNPAIIDSIMDKVNSVKYINKNTPEFWIANYWSRNPKNQNELGHHGNHARWLHEYCLKNGQTNHTAYWGEGENQKYPEKPETWMEFVIRKSFE